MRQAISIIIRNQKLFFKDKGMVLSSLITPMILILLYSTFLFNTYKDSFMEAIPDFLNVEESIINGTVACQLVAGLLSVTCVTVSFTVNLIMIQDKVTGAKKDFLMAPVKKSTISLCYFISTFLNSFMINMIAYILCLFYIHTMGWYLSINDIFIIILDIILFVLFGSALSSLVCLPLSTHGQASAVGTIVSAGYGFIAGAYMPIHSFSESLQKILSFLPSTYSVSLIKNHMLRGIFEEMKTLGFSSEAIKEIGTSIDCHPAICGYTITTLNMYEIIIGTTLICILIYTLLSKREK